MQPVEVMSMERYICIHGHFYQPPRENPWLEAIELQDSAFPYHDWNERITAECYAPNAFSRILDEQGRIAQIVNNYAKISFNFGPTLLAWLAQRSVKVYRAILEADAASAAGFSGHGSAMAQAYNHMIMPLASRRDKLTQAIWGIRDFEHRFGRKPEGMWLPETAVDTETLEVLAEMGIAFTILSPYQAKAVRKIGDADWRDVTGGHVDPTMAYAARLPSGRSINLFFYDGPISRAVAFERLLVKGEDFANRLVDAFDESRQWPQLAHIATDGESYGHHHFRGEMGLAWALRHIEENHLARPTNYGEYLERHPPTHEAQILENSSWSCAHGLERWKSDCGCNSGGRPGWNQSWRAPLRAALDWLRDTLTPLYEQRAREFLKDPWAARDQYIDILLDRSEDNLNRWLGRHGARILNDAEKVTLLELMEMQRHAMLMYTSCGWFFDELSGIETVQVIQYAGRALQLAEQLFGDEREAEFLKRLEPARSNLPEHGDGRRIYEKFVRPARVNMEKLAAHYGISSLFEKYPARINIYSFTVEREDYKRFDARRVRLAMGRARFTSTITRESGTLTFGVLHFGDHHLNCGVRLFRNEEAYHQTLQELHAAFSAADFPQVIRLLDKHFGESTYSLRNLFRDEQRKVLNKILNTSLARAESHFRQVFERRAQLMRFLTDLNIPLPKAFGAAAEFTINLDLARALEAEELDVERVRQLLEEARSLQIKLDDTTLEFTMRKSIEGMMRRLAARPVAIGLLERIVAAIQLVEVLPFELNLWTMENLYYEMLENSFADFQKQAQQGDETARQWMQQFQALGALLRIHAASSGHPA
jgi:alpha-amylase/alpha-mannosidase (GH57 family)